MRVRLRHDMLFAYAPAARSIIKVLRVEPRNHNGQRITGWRIAADVDCRLKPGEDAFGNFTHTFAVQGEVENVTLSIEAEVETFETAGVVRGAVERFPPEFYLRDTALTEPTPDMRRYASAATAARATDLEKLHDLLATITDDFAILSDADGKLFATAAEAFAQKKGTAAGLTHAFVTSARLLGIPARFVSGYYLASEGEQIADHCWAEAHIEKLGWVGFDAKLGLCATDAHVRLAASLDHLGAIWTRGAFGGTGAERMETKIRVLEPRLQA